MKLHNTLTRQVEEIKPLKDGEISLYTCGLTVYSQPHIGNWVVFIYWDVLQRVLQNEGYKVKRVQNITDVGHLTSDEDAGEDKMLASALQEGTTAWQIAEKYIDISDHEAYELLGLIKPEFLPRATDYIDQQIEFIKQLEEKGYTYKIADGVYFDTSKLDDYGKLAQLDIAGLRFGARVADTGKKNPTDFALWKFSPTDQKRDMQWESPWGVGFPGWHIECSAIAREILGDQIDIHTGGIDHIPVHHTNEIAQTEALTGKKFANMWVHANHIKVNGTKMSKSLGNIYTLQDILDKGFDIQAFKLMILSKHYRTEGNFTWENLEAAQNSLHSIYAAADMKWQPELASGTTVAVSHNIDNLIDALRSDMQTPTAIKELRAIMLAYVEDGVSEQANKDFQDMLEKFDSLLGLNLANRPDINGEQKELVQKRAEAKQRGDFASADALRQQLKQQGIGLEDCSNGTRWYRV